MLLLNKQGWGHLQVKPALIPIHWSGGEVREMKNKKKVLYNLGIALIFASFALWIIPFAAPFAPVSAKSKAGIISGAVIVAEVLFWAGVLLVGKEVAKKIRGYVNPMNWRKKGPNVKEANKEEA
jgi:uncharacterized membrane protein